MDYNFFDFIGNIGVFLILLMYLSLQAGKIVSQARLYSLLNALGAALILISLCFKFNFSAFVIELFWLLISLYGVWKSLRKDDDHSGGYCPDESSTE